MRRFCRDAPGARFPRERRDHLEALESEHFWFGPRQRLLRNQLARFDLPDAPAAIELGCGTGSFLPVLAEHAATVVGVDGYGASVELAGRIAPNAQLAEADVTALPFGAAAFDLAVALDVLEHVEPVAFLDELHRVVRPGGALLVAVPAFQVLWSRTDADVGHRCRYNVSMLRSELERTGWHLLDHTHYQLLLFPLMYLSRRALGGGRPGSLERRPPRLVNAALRAISALEVRALSGLSLPAGSSLIARARRSSS